MAERFYTADRADQVDQARMAPSRAKATHNARLQHRRPWTIRLYTYTEVLLGRTDVTCLLLTHGGPREEQLHEKPRYSSSESMNPRWLPVERLSTKCSTNVTIEASLSVSGVYIRGSSMTSSGSGKKSVASIVEVDTRLMKWIIRVDRLET